MFDIGFWELLIIGVVAVVVLGPERLPGAIKATAKTVRDVKGAANGFKQEVSHQLKIHELHENLKKAEQAGLKNLDPDVQRSVDELKAAAASVQQPYAKPQNHIQPDTQNNSTQVNPIKDDASK